MTPPNELGPQRAAPGEGLRDVVRWFRGAPGSVRIRPLVRHDDPAIAAIIRRVMTEHGAAGPGFAIHDPEVDAMSLAFRGRRAAYFVLEEAGRVLGGAGFQPLQSGPADVCELQKMYFLPEARGRGLGARLLAICVEGARRAGFRTCYLETLATMERARRLYESFGFERAPGPLGDTGHFGCDAWYVLRLEP